MRIDNRAGSNPFIEPLRSLGIDVEETILPAGDVEILGNGPGGPVLVGVEIKTMADMIASMRSGRFADQLRKMRDTYQISWLLVEGRLRKVSGTGLQIRRKHGWVEQPGHVTYSEIARWTLTMAMRGGCLLWRTESRSESIEWLRNLNAWLTLGEWEEHRSHMDWYRPEPVGNPFTGPSLVQKVAAVLPGIGLVRSAKVAAHFKTVDQMINADEAEWVKVEGIGKKGAKNIVAAIRNAHGN